jgi:hypothetical protein
VYDYLNYSLKGLIIIGLIVVNVSMLVILGVSC